MAFTYVVGGQTNRRPAGGHAASSARRVSLPFSAALTNGNKSAAAALREHRACVDAILATPRDIAVQLAGRTPEASACADVLTATDGRKSLGPSGLLADALAAAARLDDTASADDAATKMGAAAETYLRGLDDAAVADPSALDEPAAWTAALAMLKKIAAAAEACAMFYRSVAERASSA
jgi:hypothetical protein